MNEPYNPINLDLLLSNMEQSFRIEFLEQHIKLEKAAADLERRLGRFIAHSTASKKGHITRKAKQNQKTEQLRREMAA